MVLYVDILFIINFSMDFLSLFLCGMLMHKRIHRIRIILASLLGASYAVFQQLITIKLLASVALFLFVAIIMIVICFKERKFKQYSILTIVYFFISSAIGGIMSALYSFFNRILAGYIMEHSSIVGYKNARGIIVIGLTIIMAIILTRIFTMKKENKSVELEILLNKKKYKYTAFCDTGNILREPFSGKSVILVCNSCELGVQIEGMDAIKKRIIPYEDVHGKGMISGVIPEKIIINGKEVAAVVAGVKNKAFNGYLALVPGNLL